MGLDMNSKIRILHIIPKLNPGGAERLVVDLLEAIDKVLFEVGIIVLFPESGTFLEQKI
jgi:hypothetical protein